MFNSCKYLLVMCLMFCKSLQVIRASLTAQLVKSTPTVQETWVQSLGWEDPLEKERLPTPVFWPGEFHGLFHGVTKSFSLHFISLQIIKTCEYRTTQLVLRISYFSFTHRSSKLFIQVAFIYNFHV